jgi:hypothetical protein
MGRWAIKVPSLRAHGDGISGVLWSWTRGVQANLSESGWSGSPGTCPMIWSLAGLVNVYPRCDPVIEDLSDEEYQAIGFLGPVDPKPSNVGRLAGSLVWIDYDMSWNDCRKCNGQSVPL